jgi:cytochrome oxidase Cu insertion factor (SCO1/SenC/PrrC family)
MHLFRWPTLIVCLVLFPFVAACGSDDPTPAARAGAAIESSVTVELAPEFESIDGWFNSEPLTLETLRGKPVLIVFWSDT